MDRGEVTNFNTAIKAGNYQINDPNMSLPGNPGRITYGVLNVDVSATYVVQTVYEMFSPKRILKRIQDVRISNTIETEWSTVYSE